MSKFIPFGLTALIVFGCSQQKRGDPLQKELATLDLNRGDIALCRSDVEQFGSVDFGLGCDEEIKKDFNVATSLLHSFEYTEAEKMYAKVIEKDPQCVMAYWGAAMCNFHPLWVPPNPMELEKGAKIIALARSITKEKSTRESDYVEAIATIYDQWNTLDHRARVLKFEKASRQLSEKYPDDKEAAIFYALALGASADPADRTFRNQKKAGEILNRVFAQEPNHPGIAHYMIHNYDYPELAELGLPAARKYAAIATASAHAQHMPSHIFTRLGFWDEAIQSNINSVAAAQCYAENSGFKGHWDEELHGLDYLTYAYLQKADDEKAREQLTYLRTIKEVFPINFKEAYCFASMPARFAMERRDWAAAAKLALEPVDFPWEKFLWEQANVNFARLLGAVHMRKPEDARAELKKLEVIHSRLLEANENYQAHLILIQIKASQGWIKLAEGEKKQAIQLMTQAADMEDATAKHPVTPGEVIPARELLGDIYMEIGDFAGALEAYEADLRRHPNRFNGLYGAAHALEKLGQTERAASYYQQLLSMTKGSVSDRPQMAALKSLIHR